MFSARDYPVTFMSHRLVVSVLVIGDEILDGFVRDTNSGWLASRLRCHGVPLSRIVAVSDCVAEIDEALTAELARERPRLVLTTGGVGSTPDDVTYRAIAASLGRGLAAAPEIVEHIEGALEWTRRHGVDIDDEFADHMMSMARIPEGARVLRRTGGFAPGVRVDVDGGMDVPDGASVVILPGVPSQLRDIVRDVLEPELLAGRGQPGTIAEITHRFPESLLNHCLVRLTERYPSVKVGSYAGEPMLVRLRGHPEEVAAAAAQLRTYLHELESRPGADHLREAWSARLRAAREQPPARRDESSRSSGVPGAGPAATDHPMTDGQARTSQTDGEHAGDAP